MLVTSDVPLSSIAGRLFFIPFRNDLPGHLTECPNFRYCDDMKIVSRKKDSLPTDNQSLESWCEENKIVLNSKKCKTLSVNGVNFFELYGTILKETNCRKYFGMIINSTLSWTVNCERRVEKALTAFYSKNLYTLFSKFVDLDSSSVFFVKEKLKALYWKYLDFHYNEDNTSKWRILRFCGNCKPEAKLSELKNFRD